MESERAEKLSSFTYQMQSEDKNSARQKQIWGQDKENLTWKLCNEPSRNEYFCSFFRDKIILEFHQDFFMQSHHDL